MRETAAELEVADVRKLEKVRFFSLSFYFLFLPLPPLGLLPAGLCEAAEFGTVRGSA